MGTALSVITTIFLTPMLKFFGSPDNVLGYAQTYTRITAVGFPFLVFSVGSGHLIRADGSPGYAMLCNLSGAVINTILDPVFIFVFDMDMTGAALATVNRSALFFSYGCPAICANTRTVHLSPAHLIPRWRYTSRIISPGGAAPSFNQVAMMIVQIVHEQIACALRCAVRLRQIRTACHIRHRQQSCHVVFLGHHRHFSGNAAHRKLQLRCRALRQG